LATLLGRVFTRSPPASPWDNREPIRGELFGVERLEGHARSLAQAQPVIPRPTRGRQLADRLADNETALLHACQAITRAIAAGHTITPAADWLIDNDYLVEARIREIRSDLPPGYYRQLPKLSEGPFALYPRVFGVAWAFVAHTDSRFEPQMLRRFIRAYQDVQPLTIGELWALAITLRIVLLENLRRLAEQVVCNDAARQAANDLADRLLGVGGRVAESVPAVLADLERTSLPNALALQLVHRLRDQDPRFTPALVWLDARLAAEGTTAETIVHDEHQRQGAANVTVRNIITSMRLIADVDWAELFEDVSVIDTVLGDGSNFQGMDFTTRNLYCSAIEELARGSRLTEIEVARRAILACTGEVDERRGDPGYHLLAGGRAAFAISIAFRSPARGWLARLSRALGLRGYLSAVGVLSAILLAIPLAALGGAGPRTDLAHAAGNARRHPGDGRRGRAGEPQRRREFRRSPVAEPGMARWRAPAAANAGRCPDTPDHAPSHRHAGRAVGGSSSRQPAERSPFRPAHRLG
jgi:cyclic beta-1,2-glucan synthetase